MVERALVVHDSIPGIYQLDLAKTLVVAGRQRQALGDYEGAREALSWALDIRVSALGEDHRSVARVRPFLGESLRALGRLDEALAEHKAALPVLKRNRPPDQTFVLPLLLAARAKRDSSCYDEALNLAGRALQLAERAAIYQPIPIATAMVDIAEVLNASRSFNSARDHATHALSLQSETLGGRHLYVAPTYMALGRSARGRRHLPNARNAFEKAIESIRSATVRPLPLYGEALCELALIASRQEAPEEAEELAEEAIASLQKGLGEDHPQVAESLKRLELIREGIAGPDDALAAGSNP
jgi:serine/threonine-protein kinase